MAFVDPFLKLVGMQYKPLTLISLLSLQFYNTMKKEV